MENQKEAYRRFFCKNEGKLSDADIEKACSELNESPESLENGFRELRAMMAEKQSTEQGAKIVEKFGGKDDAFLLRFLRARKFDVKKAYELMACFIKFREKYPEISENLQSEVVRKSLENGYPGLLPFKDKEGHVVLVFAIGTWDSKLYSFDTVLQGYILLLEQLLENESAQINGFVIIENFKHYSMAQAFALRPTDLKKMVDMLQGAFPARFKGVHFIYQPWYFTWTYALVKPFLKKKLADRVHVHGYNLDAFYSLFDRDQLPVEFGGNAEGYDPLIMTEQLYTAIKDKELEDDITAKLAGVQISAD
ncbi:retinaldehyde-binding protein 1-like [Liolophura sinensis]|uniref:retinaldehyde-binding protein 1-like n=1 Tax=Liolophura sinensis TaxID=3198878 RepID=UPI0031580865